jgi:hypothetical protein
MASCLILQQGVASAGVVCAEHMSACVMYVHAGLVSDGACLNSTAYVMIRPYNFATWVLALRLKPSRLAHIPRLP